MTVTLEFEKKEEKLVCPICGKMRTWRGEFFNKRSLRAHMARCGETPPDLRPRTFNLSTKQYDILVKKGRGNASKLLRKIVDEWLEKQDANTR